MTNVDRWLLPDGFEDILPEKARRIESLRRGLTDLHKSWGYELIIPPLMEYTDSLLIGMGEDVDLMTFKVTDQLSGRSLGIRADITSQVARIDAHSLRRNGPTRLCYAGHILHTKPKFPLATRSPIKVGVELFGEAGVTADIEVLSLFLASLRSCGLAQLNIDLGHVEIFRSLAAAAGFSEEQEQQLFDLLQAKAAADIRQWLEDNEVSEPWRTMFSKLPKLSGGIEVLTEARQSLEQAPDKVAKAIDTLEQVANAVIGRYPEANIFLDLCELRGYHYHTGIVFAAFAPGYGAAVANGGRYDHVGEVFGRSRSATGFDVDLRAIESLLPEQSAPVPRIFAPASEDEGQWPVIEQLRSAGEIVVCGFPGQDASDSELQCQRQLVLIEGKYQVVPV